MWISPELYLKEQAHLLRSARIRKLAWEIAGVVLIMVSAASVIWGFWWAIMGRG